MSAQPAPKKKSGAWAAYRRLLGYTSPYWMLLVAAGIAMVVEAVAGGLFVQLMDPLVNRGFVNPEPRMAVILPLQIIGLFVLRGVAGYITDYGMARAGRSMVRDLRNQIIGKYLRMPSSHFDIESVPSMVSRLNFDTEQVAQAGTDAAKAIVTDSLTIAYMLGLMLYVSFKVTFAVLLVVPLIGVVVWYVGRRYRRISRGIQEDMGRLAQAAEQSLASQQDVKVYGTQAFEQSRYAALANRVLRLNVKVEATRAGSSALVQMLAAFALAAIIAVATRQALVGELDAGQFVQLMMAMMAIIPSMRRLTNVQAVIGRGVAAAERLFAVLDAPEESDAGKAAFAGERARGDLVFDNVSLRYSREDAQTGYALQDISFSARPGTVTAIVGRSGSGKTSLVRLVPRFYEPSSGRITLDGVDLDQYRLADLRQQIALVGQRVMLFDDTIGANIAYGTQADPQRLRAVAEAANAWEFIERLPQGMDTPVGENGALLSGGQRQRLAIARAMLKDAPILILDEATAALDTESERLVQDALEHLMPDRTTLVIAHRLSTIEHADQVLVLDHGKLVEQGTHAELLARDGLYAHLHRMQFREPGQA
ncbi:lipid A export permease/ATP-binding protein MsbA [Luteimonas sp. 8-5]|uniref:lipid A export permease/ATP-binding protein MsbA n=1 Tax=Luteimonas sp. 8-5 TaxID=3039387 RepID=UPI002436FDFE|nr:lipid A export permease/ATP-binding protein MsbA [Luteimonas sp. 8-5]MDG6348347.1 lipid A export permease/ATP-binding protein MsbA [Luteimonas sp. 8-5]